MARLFGSALFCGANPNGRNPAQSQFQRIHLCTFNLRDRCPALALGLAPPAERRSSPSPRRSHLFQCSGLRVHSFGLLIMIREFLQFLSDKLTACAIWMTRLAIRMSGASQTAPNSSAAPIQHALPSLRDFDGSAEEAAVLLALPPAYLAKQHVVIPIGETGAAPESIEEVKLTSSRKAIARTEFNPMDRCGLIGGVPAGLCHVCNRFSFHGVPCSTCKLFTCPCCSLEVEEAKGPLLLCIQCEPRWRWQKDNWATPKTPFTANPDGIKT